MRCLIEDFRIVPAGHCGSGAMRNLIYHYCNLDLEEGVVFGLGAGLDTVYFDFPDAEPAFMLFGRGATMEASLADTLGLDYEEKIQPDDDLAWPMRETCWSTQPSSTRLGWGLASRWRWSWVSWANWRLRSRWWTGCAPRRQAS